MTRPERTSENCQNASMRPAATLMSCIVAGTDTRTTRPLTSMAVTESPIRRKVRSSSPGLA